MRKLIVLATITFFLAFQFACNGLDAPSPEGTTPVEETSPIKETETPLPGEPVNPVVILVVDDFGQLDPSTINDIRPPNEGNCLVTPSGFGYTSSGFSGVSSGGISHGNLVYSALQTFVTVDAGGTALASTILTNSLALLSGNSNPSWLKHVDLYEIDSGHLLLVAVDTGGFTTVTITDNISDAFSVFQTGITLGNYLIDGPDRFVLNMSFGIVPCGNDNMSVGDYETLTKDELDQFRAQLAGLVTQSGIPEEEAVAYISRPMSQIYEQEVYDEELSGVIDRLQQAYFVNDPFFLYLLERESDNITVINVGAAGNLAGYSYPFAPALWDSVVSISASYDEVDSDCIDITLHSNAGEVMLPGHHPNDCYAAGTSFAAPRMSLQAALHLLGGGSNSCAGSLQTTFPPLRYVSLANLPHQTWENLDLTDAAGLYCDPFPAP